jgi:DedD protein
MDFLLKQRLVGAVVLVALAVIFIPMLLEGPDRTMVPEMEPLPEPVGEVPGRPLSSFPAPDEIPPQPEQSVIMEDAETGVTEDMQEQPLELPSADAASEPRGEPVAPTAVAEEEQTPVSEPPVIAPQAVSEKAAEAAGPLSGWVVQVGSFSNQANAVGLRDKLRAGGFTTQVEKVTVDRAVHYRVRVGPFLERGEADRVREKIAGSFELKGRVMSYP